MAGLNRPRLVALGVVLVAVTAVTIGVIGLGGPADVDRVDPEAIADPSAPTPTGNETPPETVSSETVRRGFDVPTAMSFLPDGRLLVLEKGGDVHLTDPDSRARETATYLSLSDVDSSDSRGLLDVTLHPNFEDNGYVYLFYSHDDRKRNRVIRVTHEARDGGLSSRADPDDAELVWEEAAVGLGRDHEGGAIDFGPDGKLYVTTGEEFEASQAQNLSNDGGKVLRLNPDGSVPEDNPYVGNESVRDEIWASGFRNPWRAAWDIPTGRFFVGDVGSRSVEEVNVVRRGKNYGWPDCEGACDEPGYVDPIHAYPHETEGDGYAEQAITGGLVYRGTVLPERLHGAYVYGDYADGWIRYLTFEPDGDVAASHTLDPDAGPVIAFAEGPDGALYTATYRGTISRYVASGADDAPTITSVAATPTQGVAPHTVSLSATASDSGDETLRGTWVVHGPDGERTTVSGTNVTHTFEDAGRYVLHWEVSDGNVRSSSEPITVDVGVPPEATIALPANGSTFRAGDEIRFRGTATDPDGTITERDYSWTVQFRHDSHVHPVETVENATNGTLTVPRTGHSYHDFTRYRIALEVTDEDGLTDTATTTVHPERSPLTLRTEPAGIPVFVDDVRRETPQTVDSLIGFRHTLRPAPEGCVDGTRYTFDGWTDGANETRTLTVPDSNLTLVATYSATGSCPGGSDSSGAPGTAGPLGLLSPLVALAAFAVLALALGAIRSRRNRRDD